MRRFGCLSKNWNNELTCRRGSEVCYEEVENISHHSNCGRCGKPVRQAGDYLRAQLQGACVLFHWRCFTALMRESNQRTTVASARVTQ
jgi:hypothetical protein